MKTRTIVSIESSQLRALRARARAAGVSLAELVRRLVAEHLAEPTRVPPVPPAAYARLVALGSSGRSDVADRHDARIAEALTEEHGR
jgi:ribbon-helix-helix CopG family protein